MAFTSEGKACLILAQCFLLKNVAWVNMLHYLLVLYDETLDTLLLFSFLQEESGHFYPFLVR